jgi:hypothetical protein
MDLLSQIALAAGLAWASGIRLYAVVFAFGMLSRFGYVTLPGDLTLLSHDWVLVASGVMLVGEFVADKVPWFDSLWDAAHTFIRIPLGAALSYGALADQGAPAQFAAALIGGTITSGAHLAKAGSRAVLNHSPEPFSNWIASFTEDGLVLGAIWLIVAHPLVFLVLLVVFMALLIWLLPKLFRALRWLWRRLLNHQGAPSAAARADATAPPDAPMPSRALRHDLTR